MNKRRDQASLEFIGNWLTSHYTNISGYDYDTNEDFVTDLTLYTTEGAKQCEVKTIRNGKKPYKSDYIRNYSPTLFEDYDNFWFLNYTTKNGEFTNSKWDKITKGVYDCVLFYNEDERILYYFTKDQIIDSVIDYCDMYQTHTTYAEEKTKLWERKVVIDLNKATRKIMMKNNTNNDQPRNCGTISK